MAAVMITKELRGCVQNRIQRIAQAEIAEECPELSQAYNIDASDLYMKAMWGEYMNVFDMMPKQWIRKVDKVEIHVIEHGWQPTIEAAPRDLEVWVRFDHTANAYMRPCPEMYSSVTCKMTRDQLVANSHLIGADKLLQRLEDTKRAKEIDTKYTKLQAQIDAFLKQCRSLNEAVKIMPNLRLYLDKQYIDRLDRRVEKRTQEQARAEELLKGINQDEMAAIAMAAHLQGVK